jgi:hypothetical protein
MQILKVQLVAKNLRLDLSQIEKNWAMLIRPKSFLSLKTNFLSMNPHNILSNINPGIFNRGNEGIMDIGKIFDS